MKKTFIIVAAAGLAALAQPVAAQGTLIPLSAEVKGGIGFPTGDFSDVDTGFGFGATVRYNIIPMLAVYGSYNWMEFGDEEDFNVTDSGFTVGGQVSLPLGGALALNPWARAGVLFHTLEVESLAGTVEGDRETGFEVAGGLSFPLGLVVSFTPGVAYRTYGTDSAFLGDVSYIALELGLNFNL